MLSVLDKVYSFNENDFYSNNTLINTSNFKFVFNLINKVLVIYQRFFINIYHQLKIILEKLLVNIYKAINIFLNNNILSIDTWKIFLNQLKQLPSNYEETTNKLNPRHQFVNPINDFIKIIRSRFDHVN